ncbi:hypothetical protein [Bifidobacterium panos]|uniref:Uncharacterized protein n=1 Tax=Bifidobacterium panos TaxID=2675321 RepID=A0ABX1SYD1_9BIFI|nr:hypothetical protein [Bifidobacterium sp. DSM 109963]NMN02202.1 hypothetical protein [Bifidobacterium sp. DSM 109963]
MRFVGYRNTKLVEQLARDGRLLSTWGSAKTFDPMQYTLLMKMASSSYDWPLDKQAEKDGRQPRVYQYGWLAMAQDLGMTLPDTPADIEVIGNEPRVPRKETTAIQRLSQTAKKLEASGLIKCLRKGSPQKRNNAIWLLTIGTPDENAEVEAYVRRHMRL